MCTVAPRAARIRGYFPKRIAGNSSVVYSREGIEHRTTKVNSPHDLPPLMRPHSEYVGAMNGMAHQSFQVLASGYPFGDLP